MNWQIYFRVTYIATDGTCIWTGNTVCILRSCTCSMPRNSVTMWLRICRGEMYIRRGLTVKVVNPDLLCKTSKAQNRISVRSFMQHRKKHKIEFQLWLVYILQKWPTLKFLPIVIMPTCIHVHSVISAFKKRQGNLHVTGHLPYAGLHVQVG